MKIGTLYQLTMNSETKDLGFIIDDKDEDFINVYWTHVAGGEVVKYYRDEFQQILDSGLVTLVKKPLTELLKAAIVYL